MSTSFPDGARRWSLFCHILPQVVDVKCTLRSETIDPRAVWPGDAEVALDIVDAAIKAFDDHYRVRIAPVELRTGVPGKTKEETRDNDNQ